jgi:long-chain acyl-CoA synthetase
MSAQPLAAPRPGSLEFWATQAPQRPALREGARGLAWEEWNAQADRVAELLSARAGIGPGDHVAVCMKNRLEWFVTQAAAAKLDASLVPIAWRLTPSEVHYIVADCGARAFCFDAEDVEALARVWTDQPASDKPSQVVVALSVMPSARRDVLSFGQVAASGKRVPRVAAHSPQSIVYTSGTTGRPRGVVAKRPDSTRPAGAVRQPSQLMAAWSSAAARNLLGAPLNHAAGQASARATLQSGGCVHIMPRFDAREALRIIDDEKITMTFLVPTMLNRIMNLAPEVLAAHDVSSIRIITTGASPCPQSIKEQVIAYFGTHCLVENYGTSEVGLIARMLPEDHLRKPGACGRLLERVEVRIVDADGHAVAKGAVGEILVKTPIMIERYLNEEPPRELVDGFFATGDVGRFDEDGYLYVLDRKKDMIIAGGVNIYPAEIENALRKHPAVLDVAVFGIPHTELGEQVKAVVERVDGAALTEAELLAFVADELAPYKRPRSVDFVAEIPRNATGKPLKVQMRAPYWAGSGKVI